MFTFDHKISGHNQGKSLGRVHTHDGKFVDSTGAFLLGELERLDPKVHAPLVMTSYGRDIDFREDVSIADDFSSFTTSNFAAGGGLGDGSAIGRGKSWAGKNSTQIPGVSVDITKTSTGLNLWAMEVAYTIIELESAAKLGRPIDQQQIGALNMKYELDSDEQVYVGDLTLNVAGLLTSGKVAVTNLPNGAGGNSKWSTKTPDEIVNDLGFAIGVVWASSGWKIKPNRILIPPAQFNYISTAKVASANGLISIKRYIEENNLLTTNGEGNLTIEAAKYCIGSGVGGTLGVAGTVDRMLVYTKMQDLVRFPRTPLQKTPIQYDGLYHKSTYFGKLGGVEFVYPETLGYFDGL